MGAVPPSELRAEEGPGEGGWDAAVQSPEMLGQRPGVGSPAETTRVCPGPLMVRGLARGLACRDHQGFVLGPDA